MVIKDIQDQLISKTPLAFTFNEVVFNAQGVPIDYRLLEVNPSFEKKLGLKKTEVVGKNMSEWLLKSKKMRKKWFDAFKELVLTGDRKEFDKMLEFNGRWYLLTAFLPYPGYLIVLFRDVTKLKQIEAGLLAEREKLRVTLYSIGDGVITTDKQGKVEMLNKVAEDLTGWEQEEAKDKSLTEVFDIYNENTGLPCENPVEMVLESGKIVGLANHTALKAKNGKVRSIADSAAPIKNHLGQIQGVVLVFRDVTETKEKEEKIKFLSYRDSLTGLYNRAYFEEEVKKMDTERQFPLTIIMGDLDGLKLINDVFGHQEGDQALIKVGEIFKDSCREEDVVARWGGDEFIVLLPKTTEETGQKICDRIKEVCCDKKMAIGTTLSISLGCASKTDKGEKWQEVLKKAEENMYQSKLLGEKSYRSSILSSIKNALFEKSCETKEHGERLGRFCREIGKTIGLPAYKLDELEVLAMLHDIGKIAINDHILQKPCGLTEEEWLVVKKHPEIGYRIAQAIPDLINIADYILAHHERWDGKGYPRGLAGEEIPPLARVLAVADAYDAMTQDRPYRKAISTFEAKEELRRNAGTQFDPEVVDIFLTYLEK